MTTNHSSAAPVIDPHDRRPGDTRPTGRAPTPATRRTVPAAQRPPDGRGAARRDGPRLARRSTGPSADFAGSEPPTAMDPAEIVTTVLDSGLRGRGGAGFPTGRKWQTVADNALGWTTRHRRRQRRRRRARHVQGPQHPAPQPLPGHRRSVHRRTCGPRRPRDHRPQAVLHRRGRTHPSRPRSRCARRTCCRPRSTARSSKDQTSTSTARRARCSRRSTVAVPSRESFRPTGSASSATTPTAGSAPDRRWSTTSRRSPTSPTSSPAAPTGSAPSAPPTHPAPSCPPSPATSNATASARSPWAHRCGTSSKPSAADRRRRSRRCSAASPTR